LAQAASYGSASIKGAARTKDQLEGVVANQFHACINHYCSVRSALYKRFGAASELVDVNSLALLAGRLHEIFEIVAD
jgi:hypothetical protein